MDGLGKSYRNSSFYHSPVSLFRGPGKDDGLPVASKDNFSKNLFFKLIVFM